MKAWTDLEQSVSLYWTGDQRSPTTMWYLDNGVKIERSEETFNIYNTMVGDRYERVKDDEYLVFENEGWLAGCYNVCINHFRRRLYKAEELISHEIKKGRQIHLPVLNERKEELEKKLDRYIELREKLPKLANNLNQV